MKLYCNECYREISGDSVLAVQVLDMAEADAGVFVSRAPVQKFCMSCAAKLLLELRGRFNGKVDDDKLLRLLDDFKNFLRDNEYSGIKNVISYLQEGVNIYFGYDAAEETFTDGQLIQCQLLTVDAAQTMMEENPGLLEHITNHVFVTPDGSAFTMQEGHAHLKHH